MKDFYYNIKAFLRNLPLFLSLAWGWRKWDSQFTIDALVVLLKEHAKDQLADKHHLHHVQRYRQAMHCAGLLEQAYSDYHYPSVLYLRKKRKPTIADHRFTMHYDGNQEILDKMSKLAYDKETAIVKARKAYAWEFLGKHIERMWS